MDLTARQEKILEIVKEKGPISGEEIASLLNLSRASVRPHLAALTMAGLLSARPRVGYYYTGKPKKNDIENYLRSIKVGEIKSRPVVIKEATSVYDAAVTLFLEDVGTLFVVDEKGLLQGVVSRKDFLKTCLGSSDLHKMPVGVIMTRMPNIIVAYPEENVLEAAHKIIEFEVDCLPVVREEKPGRLEVLGRVTKTNLARVLVSLGGQI